MDKRPPVISFFNLTDAVKDVSNASGAGETAAAGAKLVGKTIFNAGIIAGKIGIKVVQELPGMVAKDVEKQLRDNPNISGEKRSRMEDYVRKHKKPGG